MSKAADLRNQLRLAKLQEIYRGGQHSGKARFKRVNSGGYTFVFKFEHDQPDMLHIYAWHRKTAEDAIRVWFNHDEQYYNKQKQRYESLTKTEGIYWFWK